MRPGLADLTRSLPGGLTLSEAKEYPGKPLRGYGTLAGEYALGKDAGGGECSWLAIRCESEEKARIVHAKYLSDLHMVGEVGDERVTVGGLEVPTVTATEQGAISAFRNGGIVYVVAGGTTRLLERALLAVAPHLADADLAPTASVPMYIDSWDKYGFRFYYAEFETPWPTENRRRPEWVRYDVLQEFDFAKRCGDFGLISWHNEDKTDQADGMSNENMWNWVSLAAEKRGLPFVVNSFMGDAAWLLNRDRFQEQLQAPNYCGGFYTAGDAFHAGKGHLSWAADELHDNMLAVMQETWRRTSARGNTIEYLEPHGELRHGEHDLLNEYGPLVDRSYRDFLIETHGSIEAVSKRWYGDSRRLASTRDIRLPELAHFFGFDEDAIDIAGEWRFRYEDSKAEDEAAPEPAWFMPGLDDSEWLTIAGPDSDEAMHVPHKAAVWRKSFPVPARWKAEHERVWLWSFSLNRRGGKWPVYLNGRKVGEPDMGRMRNIAVMEVTDAVRSGENVIALRLPECFLGYRVYLTGKEPKWYPRLGRHLNAQWVDFIRWQAWVRDRTVRRSMEAIRDVDPDRSIVCMAPDSFMSGLKVLCEDYGGHFHNTGYMTGWWSEPLPMQMRSAGLPFSLEPSAPAGRLEHMKANLGFWLTEGVNAVHYFIHLGSIYYHGGILPWFEDNTKMFGLIGKIHIPKADIAMYYTDDINNILDWPMHGHDSCGYVATQFNGHLHKEYHMDGVTQYDFDRGNADHYKVILDTNTYVMDEELLEDIEAWVRRGGVYLTAGSTGQSTLLEPDTWPITRLSGYRIKEIRGHPDWVPVRPSATEPAVYDTSTWGDRVRNIGQRLEAVGEGCTDLMHWPDGSTAIGLRNLGKGMVVHVGITRDRSQARTQMFEWLKLPRIKGLCEDGSVNSTHNVSNNGLYDVWAVWHWEGSRSDTVHFTFRDGLKPAYCVDYRSGRKMELIDRGETVVTEDMAMQPLETRVLVTPRQEIAKAPLVWFELQRGWWSGTKKPTRTVHPYEPRTSLRLNDGWLMQSLEGSVGVDVSRLAEPALDDREWQKIDLTTWPITDRPGSRRVFLRRHFTVPEDWDDGRIEIWWASWKHEAFHGADMRGGRRVWLDGEPVAQPEPRQLCGVDLTDRLKPGGRHVLALHMEFHGDVGGSHGNMWLLYMRRPEKTIDLAGEWTPRGGDLKWGGEPLTLPGPWKGQSMARRKVRIDRSLRDMTVMMRIDMSRPRSRPNGLLINGHWTMRLHHEVGHRVYLNITPWVRFGEENEITIVGGGARDVDLKVVSLEFFVKGTYP